MLSRYNFLQDICMFALVLGTFRMRGTNSLVWFLKNIVILHFKKTLMFSGCCVKTARVHELSFGKSILSLPILASVSLF